MDETRRLPLSNRKKKILKEYGWLYVILDEFPGDEEKFVEIAGMGMYRYEFYSYVPDVKYVRRVAEQAGYDDWEEWQNSLPDNIRAAKTYLLFKVVPA